jgi:hypothetical protein
MDTLIEGRGWLCREHRDRPSESTGTPALPVAALQQRRLGAVLPVRLLPAPSRSSISRKAAAAGLL